MDGGKTCVAGTFPVDLLNGYDEKQNSEFLFSRPAVGPTPTSSPHSRGDAPATRVVPAYQNIRSIGGDAPSRSRGVDEPDGPSQSPPLMAPRRVLVDTKGIHLHPSLRLPTPRSSPPPISPSTGYPPSPSTDDAGLHRSLRALRRRHSRLRRAREASARDRRLCRPGLRLRVAVPRPLRERSRRCDYGRVPRQGAV